MEASRWENSLASAVSCFEYHHLSCAERCGRPDRGVACIGTNQQCGSQLCSLCLADALAGEPRCVLPASGKPATSLGNLLLPPSSPMHHGGSYRSTTKTSLSYNGMVMVSGHARTCHRIGASRMAGQGWPIHIFTADWPIYINYMGSGRSDKLVATSTHNFERRCNTCHRRSELMRVGSDLVLAQ